MKNKHIFWEALILAIFIFASGILLGYLLEANRTNKVITLYQDAELGLLDLKIRDNILSSNNVDCDKFFYETLNFADKIYNEAKLLDRYEEASRISEGMILQHKKYDLLRTLLWSETLRFKEKCNSNFSTVIYFYEYFPENIETKSLQNVFSKKLGELKMEHGTDIILIPIAGNINVSSINYLREQYKIESLPTILINEKIKVTSIEQLNSLDTYLK